MEIQQPDETNYTRALALVPDPLQKQLARVELAVFI